jgi:hypothetical protein
MRRHEEISTVKKLLAIFLVLLLPIALTLFLLLWGG